MLQSILCSQNLDKQSNLKLYCFLRNIYLEILEFILKVIHPKNKNISFSSYSKHKILNIQLFFNQGVIQKKYRRIPSFFFLKKKKKAEVPEARNSGKTRNVLHFRYKFKANVIYLPFLNLVN